MKCGEMRKAVATGNRYNLYRHIRNPGSRRSSLSKVIRGFHAPPILLPTASIALDRGFGGTVQLTLFTVDVLVTLSRRYCS